MSIVLSICEVISSPSIKESEAAFSSFTFVVPKEQEENVTVRYLLVYDHFQMLKANIVDGHILSHGDHNVDLSQHYKRITQKYASAAPSCAPLSMYPWDTYENHNGANITFNGTEQTSLSNQNNLF